MPLESIENNGFLITTTNLVFQTLPTEHFISFAWSKGPIYVNTQQLGLLNVNLFWKLAFEELFKKIGVTNKKQEAFESLKTQKKFVLF